MWQLHLVFFIGSFTAMASGMAGKVRRATDSDEFDLANYDQAKCDDLAKGAFGEPLPLASMVKLSFCVGGGKLVRQKYSDDLPKLFMGSLAVVGYVDDSSADKTADSAGKFKFQHDTGKNLKFVHVFPRISGPAQGAGGDEGEEEEEEEAPQTPEDVLLTCDMEALRILMARQLETYGQKKNLMDLLKRRITRLEEIEAKMTRLERLSEEEQKLFDGVGAEELKEKSKAVSAELKAMVDAGRLTSGERAAVLEEFESKLGMIEAEVTKSEAEGKKKRVEALQGQVEAVRSTCKAVKDLTPVGLPPLKHAQDIKKYFAKVQELNKLEKANKGNYTMDQLKRLGERPEIEEAIAELERRSRGWLEPDEIFQERLDACKRSASAAAGKKAPPPPSGGGYPGAPSKSGGGGGFQTVARGGGGAKPKAGGRGGASTGNAFSALS